MPPEPVCLVNHDRAKAIMAEDESEFVELRTHWAATGAETRDKTWIRDPESARWEAFHT